MRPASFLIAKKKQEDWQIAFLKGKLGCGFRESRMNRKKCGVPCIRDYHIPVATVVGMVANGMSIESILSEYTNLKKEDIYEALAYAAAAVSERQLPMVENH
jgi:uncharacterized protein (DUF433 family)